MYTYARESAKSIIGEGKHLFQTHHDELGLDPDAEPRPDDEAYSELERQGKFVAFAARYDGELIGYCTFALGSSLKYGLKLASQENLFLSPTHRGHGIEFIKWCEHELASSFGVQRVFQYATPANSLGKAFERMGYKLTNYVYLKSLG